MTAKVTRDLEYFFDRCEPDLDGCLLWTASVDRKGYARVGSATEVSGKASRVVYTLVHGHIPPGLIVRHTCDKPACIQPRHLVLGTHADNARDRSERRRHACHRGTRRGPKLDLPGARLVRAAIGTDAEVALRFNLSKSFVNKVRRGVSWPG